MHLKKRDPAVGLRPDVLIPERAPPDEVGLAPGEAKGGAVSQPMAFRFAAVLFPIRVVPDREAIHLAEHPLRIIDDGDLSRRPLEAFERIRTSARRVGLPYHLRRRDPRPGKDYRGE